MALPGDEQNKNQLNSGDRFHQAMELMMMTMKKKMVKEDGDDDDDDDGDGDDGDGDDGDDDLEEVRWGYSKSTLILKWGFKHHKMHP